MARIAGVEIPNEKRIEVGLTYIYGIGKSLSHQILTEAQINPDTRVKNLTEKEVNALQVVIQNNYKTGGELRRIVQDNIRRLIEIGSYRGLRHRRGLPGRGQRTRTNARTKRGKRRTVGSGKVIQKKSGFMAKGEKK